MIRQIFIIFLLSAATARLPAQEPARFFIERIDIRNAHRVSREVVVAESRLREGRTYSERDLREAADRVSRAPYLLSADFSLEKGSERGKYVLVISVNETKPFFYGLDIVPVMAKSPRARVEFTDVTLASENEIAAGFRLFLGRRGAIHIGIEGAGDNRDYTVDYTSWVAGYTEYDLFGSRAFVTLNLKKPINAGQVSSAIEPQFVAGIPLSVNQTLTAEYDPTEVDDRGSRFGSRVSQLIATLRWSYNTTNHPLLPTRGTYVSVAPIAVWHDSEGTTFISPTKIVPFIDHNRSLAFEVTGTRWWEFAERNSAGVGVEAGRASTIERGSSQASGLNGRRTIDSRFATLDVTLSHSFWTAERVARDGDSRIQLDLRAGPRSNTYEEIYRSAHLRLMSLSLVRRTNWGLLRLGLGYAW